MLSRKPDEFVVGELMLTFKLIVTSAGICLVLRWQTIKYTVTATMTFLEIILFFAVYVSLVNKMNTNITIPQVLSQGYNLLLTHHFQKILLNMLLKP